MDNSKEYIKMCDCPEIQGEHEWEYGDWFMRGDDDGVWRIGDASFRYDVLDENAIPIRSKLPIAIMASEGDDYYLEGIIWLPRQDQLQNMVFKETGLQSMCTAIEQFSKSEVGSGVTIFGTMEQLWLAFLMHNNYHKTWNGEAWQ